MTIYAGGHILLNDAPGTGKTTLALAFSKALGLDYKRIQFTTDTLPSDIVGFTMLNNETQKFEFRPGAVFSNLLLADEINRTSPKTQAALLEAMEEHNVTVDGVTYDFVIFGIIHVNSITGCCNSIVINTDTLHIVICSWNDTTVMHLAFLVICFFHIIQCQQFLSHNG